MSLIFFNELRFSKKEFIQSISNHREENKEEVEGKKNYLLRLSNIKQPPFGEFIHIKVIFLTRCCFSNLFIKLILQLLNWSNGACMCMRSNAHMQCPRLDS